MFALDWKTAVKLPWGVLLLFGGGLSLAAALGDSGLARWIGQQVGVLARLPTFWQIVLIVALIVFSGELTSNLAAVVALMPILFEIAGGMKVDPLLLCVPAVVAASCGFMLPVATPPNAIVFGSGPHPTRQMVRAGFPARPGGRRADSGVYVSCWAARCWESRCDCRIRNAECGMTLCPSLLGHVAVWKLRFPRLAGEAELRERAVPSGAWDRVT